MSRATQAEKDHYEAMRLADCADASCRTGDTARAIGFFRRASVLEESAARGAGDLEPSRSILYRSAASLALSAGLPTECRRLAGEGLAGKPLKEIADELRDLLRRAGVPRA